MNEIGIFMNKSLLLGIFAGIFVVLTLQSAFAYHNYYPHNSHGTRLVYGFDGEFFSQEYRYVDDFYGMPHYRIYSVRSDCRGLCGCFGCKDDEITKRRVARFIVKSANERYVVTSGKSSKEAFCSDCKTDDSKTSFGSKKTYGTFGKQEDYYKPEINPSTQTFNWRF